MATNTATLPRKAMTAFLSVLAPFAPHICEELWQRLDGSGLIAHAQWPVYDEALCLDDVITVVVMINATDAPQFTLAFRAYEIMAPALKAPTVGEEPRQWTKYTGYYTGDESWSDAEVLEWNGSLAVMWVPTGNPDPVGSLTRLRRVEGNVFRQVGGDGELGKHYVFGTDAAGNIDAMRFNNNVLRRAIL